MTRDEMIQEDQALDEHIRQEAYKEWLGTLVKLWDAVDKDVDDKRLALYAEEFRCVPLGLLEKAVKRAIRNNGVYLSVPSIGALWVAIKKETGDHPNMDVMDAVALWEEKTTQRFESTIHRFGQPVATETES